MLIVLISALLAYLSMKDFKVTPGDFGGDLGLFLIRKPKALTSHVLASLGQMIAKEDLIISLERLFKGGESALVLYGPKKILSSFGGTLDLLELEDYAQADKDAHGWEIGVRKGEQPVSSSLFYHFPKLNRQEQVWYQLVLRPKNGKKGFRCQIRAAVLSEDRKRAEELYEALLPKGGNFSKIPKSFSNSQIMDFYKKRSMGQSDFVLSSDAIIKLHQLPHQSLPVGFQGK